ncbi:MAG: hypothetical protein AAF085_14660 [Planctomycetota bacterium]
MLKPFLSCVCAGLLIVFTSTLTAQEDTPDAVVTEAEAAREAAEAAYKEKFFEDERNVRGTRVTNDDAEFAQRLYTEAGSGEYDAYLSRLLYEKAYAFGLRDKRGYQAAYDSLDKLLELDASRQYEIVEMRLALMEKWKDDDPELTDPDPEAVIDTCLELSRAWGAAGDHDRAMKLLNRANRYAMRIDSPRKNDVRDGITDLTRMRKTLEKIAELEEAILDGTP